MSTALRIVGSQSQWTPLLDGLKTELHSELRRAAKLTFEIGKTLNAAKDECIKANLSWTDWLIFESGMSERSAQNMMRIHLELGVYRENLSRLPYGALIKLAEGATPLYAISEVVGRLDKGDTLTIADVAEIVDHQRAIEAIAWGGEFVLENVTLPARIEKRIQALVDIARETMDTGAMTVDAGVTLTVGQAVKYVADVKKDEQKKIVLDGKSGDKFEGVIFSVEEIEDRDEFTPNGVHVTVILKPGDYALVRGMPVLLIEKRS